MCKLLCNSYRQPSLQSPTAPQSLKTGTSYLFFDETNSDLLCFQQTSKTNSPNLPQFSCSGGRQTGKYGHSEAPMCNLSGNSYRQPGFQAPAAQQSSKPSAIIFFLTKRTKRYIFFGSKNLRSWRSANRQTARLRIRQIVRNPTQRPEHPRHPTPRANGLDARTAVVRGRFPCSRLYSECFVLARRLGHHNRRELNYKWKLVETALGRSSRPEPSAFRRTPMRARSGADKMITVNRTARPARLHRRTATVFPGSSQPS